MNQSGQTRRGRQDEHTLEEMHPEEQGEDSAERPEVGGELCSELHKNNPSKSKSRPAT